MIAINYSNCSIYNTFWIMVILIISVMIMEALMLMLVIIPLLFCYIIISLDISWCYYYHYHHVHHRSERRPLLELNKSNDKSKKHMHDLPRIDLGNGVCSATVPDLLSYLRITSHSHLVVQPDLDEGTRRQGVSLWTEL